MELVNLAGAALLLLLIRKLAWCIRWLWCYYHCQETPEHISFLQHRSGKDFDEHVRQAREQDKEA